MWDNGSPLGQRLQFPRVVGGDSGSAFSVAKSCGRIKHLESFSKAYLWQPRLRGNPSHPESGFLRGLQEAPKQGAGATGTLALCPLDLGGRLPLNMEAPFRCALCPKLTRQPERSLSTALASHTSEGTRGRSRGHLPRLGLPLERAMLVLVVQEMDFDLAAAGSNPSSATELPG